MATLSQLTKADLAAFVFRLYVAGEAPNSMLALRNLQSLCQERCADNYHIEVVDVLLSPERAWAEGVIATPMVLRVSPGPLVRIVGNLGHTEQVLSALGFGLDGYD